MLKDFCKNFKKYSRVLYSGVRGKLSNDGYFELEIPESTRDGFFGGGNV